uniref:Glycosyltransferase n=1 Tax=Parastrongyloides trichosuri TaxID=131310 RepID=A0A0N4ZA30_PARTI
MTFENVIFLKYIKILIRVFLIFLILFFIWRINDKPTSTTFPNFLFHEDGQKIYDIEPSSISIIVITQSNIDFRNYEIPLNSMMCYATHYGYKFEILDFFKNTTIPILCPQEDFFFARHCALYYYLKDNQNTTRYVFTLDADIGVINPYKRLEEYLPINENEDIVFTQRTFTHEIAASPNIIKNTLKSRQFLYDWSQYFYKTPSSFHGSDNGALLQLFVDKFGHERLNDKKKECDFIYEIIKNWNDFINYSICTEAINYESGDTLTDPEAIIFNNSIRVWRRLPFKSWVRDIWSTNSKWCFKDFLLHGMKMNTLGSRSHVFGKWKNPFSSLIYNHSICKSNEFYKLWDYKLDYLSSNKEITENLNKLSDKVSNEFSNSKFSNITYNNGSLPFDNNVYVASAWYENNLVKILYVTHKNSQQSYFKLIKIKEFTNEKSNYKSFLGLINKENFKPYQHLIKKEVITSSKLNLIVCTKVLTNFDNINKLIVFIDYWFRHDVSKIYIYVNSISEKIISVLEEFNIKYGNKIKIIYWSNLPYNYEKDKYRNPNFDRNYHFDELAKNDCILRSRNNAQFVVIPALDQEIKTLSFNGSLIKTLDYYKKVNYNTSIFGLEIKNSYTIPKENKKEDNFTPLGDLLHIYLPSRYDIFKKNNLTVIENKKMYVEHVSFYYFYNLSSYKINYVYPNIPWTRDTLMRSNNSWTILNAK